MSLATSRYTNRYSCLIYGWEWNGILLNIARFGETLEGIRK